MNAHPAWLIPIKLPMPATLGTANIYLIHTPKGAALIDTGLKDASSRCALIDVLHQHNLALESISQVVLTHHHVDHAGLIEAFARVGAEIILTDTESVLLDEFYSHTENDAARVRLFSNHPVPSSMERSVLKTFSFLRKLGGKSAASRVVRDGEIIVLAGLPFQVISTPGHTPGHLALHQPDAGILFTGDTILLPKTTYISGNPRVPDDNPYLAYLNTLERLGDIDATAYPGHGKPIVQLKHQASALIEYFKGALEATYERLSESPRFALDLCTPRNGDTRSFAQWLSLSQTVAYLNHLTVCGRAVAENLPEGIAYRRG